MEWDDESAVVVQGEENFGAIRKLQTDAGDPPIKKRK